jgi:hypothetical protein
MLFDDDFGMSRGLCALWQYYGMVMLYSFVLLPSDLAGSANQARDVFLGL